MGSEVRDVKKKPAKVKFKPSSNAEKEFYKQLRKVAKTTGQIIDVHTKGATIINEPAMNKALKEYSEMLTPWAERQSLKLLESVSKSNKRAYNNQSKAIGKALKEGLASSGIDEVGMALIHEQVALIKSIPTEAGIRAQKIAAENFYQGMRAQPDQSVIDELVEQMGMSESVAINRAKLIARTETARSNSAFVQVRAESVGATSYIWRTTMDGAERKSHKQMNGKVVQYDSPPTLSDGTTGHAGTFPNCRCYQDPVLPDLK